MRIPRIIHQTWKSKTIPKPFDEFTRTWKKHHPYWEYRLWDDTDNRQFIQEHYLWFLRYYDNYSFNIQRVDVVRYFILYTFGGLYVDIDVECFKSLEQVLQGATSVFCMEPEEHCRIHNTDRIVSNAFMACEPGHPFLYAIIKELITYVSQEKDHGRFVLETTGPMMVSRVYEKLEDKEHIKLLSAEMLSPLSYLESERYLKGEQTQLIHEKLKDAYGLHYHSGSWWKAK